MKRNHRSAHSAATLAGIAYAKDGQLLAFAVMADKLSKGSLSQAGELIAKLATKLAGCGCGS